ncbi:MAG TPA: hypothetical protein VFU69_17785, partial [Ktedonobacterales bacterium]|nr:hypothetical protein [Ktedonobacterales bacterium]
EKAATKALGRALAGLSFGTQFAPELDEKQRVVDSPVERPARNSSGAGRAGAGETGRAPAKMAQQPAPAAAEAVASEPAETDGEPPANEQQLLSIRKLCAALGREEPAPGLLTFTGAGALIRQLSREYNNARRAS